MGRLASSGSNEAEKQRASPFAGTRQLRLDSTMRLTQQGLGFKGALKGGICSAPFAAEALLPVQNRAPVAPAGTRAG